ncbi:MAG TPA: aldolase/citrate lyase family protein [Kiloniellales bacterium]
MQKGSGKRKGPMLGFWLETDNLAACEIGAIVGYDIVVLDMEHGAISTDAADRLVSHAKRLGLTVYSRVATAARVPIQQALDFGADGIIVPQITDVAHARDVAALAKYPPLGSRGIGFSRTMDYGGVDDAFLDAENRRTLCFLMIETPDALRDAEKIAALETVDGLFIGPSDLAATRGRGLPKESKEDEADARSAAEAAVRRKKRWGIPAGTPKAFAFARELGADFVTINDDLSAMRAGLEQALSLAET